MTNSIIVNYDPFAMESTVYILEDGLQKQMKVCSDINGLAETLVGLSYGNNIYSILIHAPLAITGEINKIQHLIDTFFVSFFCPFPHILMYSNNKITVEGI